MTKLKELLKYEFKEMQIEMEKSGREGRGTSQEISDRREGLVRSFFEKFYPFPYRVVKGIICDSYDNESASVDCVILNPVHPHTIDLKTNAPSVILADGVDFAIECKSNLMADKEINRCLNQCLSVKKLKRVATGVTTTISDDDDYHIPFIIWANNSLNLNTLLTKISNFYIENHIPQLEQFDILLVDNKFIVYNIGYYGFGEDRSIKRGFYYQTCEDDTLIHLLWAMTNYTPAAPSRKNILSYYTFVDNNLSCDVDINKKLNENEV